MKSCKTCDDHHQLALLGPTGGAHVCRRYRDMPCFEDEDGGPPDGCHSDEREAEEDADGMG